MKTLLLLLGLAVVAAATHLLAVGVLMAAGVGPYGQAVQIIQSGGMATYNETTTRAWFEAAEKAVTLDRFVLWPSAFLLVSIMAVRVIRIPRWWHPIVIALAVVPLSIHTALGQIEPRTPESPTLMPWVSALVGFVAYAVFTAAVLQALRLLRSRASQRGTAA